MEIKDTVMVATPMHCHMCDMELFLPGELLYDPEGTGGWYFGPTCVTKAKAEGWTEKEC